MIGMLEAIKTWTVVGISQILVHTWDHTPIACTVVKNVPEVVLMFILQTSAASDLASFPGLLHLQFLIFCNVMHWCSYNFSSMCQVQQEMVWWTKLNFLGLSPKSSKDQWDCEISNYYVAIPLQCSIWVSVLFLRGLSAKGFEYC